VKDFNVILLNIFERKNVIIKFNQEINKIKPKIVYSDG